MRSLINVVDGRLVRQTHQPAAEVDAILDANQYMRNNPNRPGGTGSANAQFLFRMPGAMYGDLAHKWRMAGGLKGTGMKLRDYCALKASLPEYSKLVTTPSGRTGLESQARRLTFGWNGAAVERHSDVIAKAAAKRKPRSSVIWSKGDPASWPKGAEGPTITRR